MIGSELLWCAVVGKQGGEVMSPLAMRVSLSPHYPHRTIEQVPISFCRRELKCVARNGLEVADLSAGSLDS